MRRRSASVRHCIPRRLSPLRVVTQVAKEQLVQGPDFGVFISAGVWRAAFAEKASARSNSIGQSASLTGTAASPGSRRATGRCLFELVNRKAASTAGKSADHSR